MNTYDDILTEKSESPAAGGEMKKAWAEKKDSDREYAYSLIRDAAAQLKNGDNLRTYLDVQSRFDKYSVSNAILIAVQCPDATRLAEVERWNEEGLRIRKGETGIFLLAPGNEYRRTDHSVGISTKVRKLFDISQTNAQPEQKAEITLDSRLLLKALIHDAPCEITVDEGKCIDVNARYDSESKTIYVRPGLDFPILFRSLSQEIATAHLAQEGHARKDSFYIAYCAAYMLCKRNHVSVDGFRFDQVPESFAQLDEKGMKSVLGKIRETANTISQDMQRVLMPAKEVKPADRESR